MIALWCDENTIGTNRNLHEPMRTCAIQYDNAIVAHRIATYWVAADRGRIPVWMYNELIRMYNDEIRTNRNWPELIRCSAMQYDAIQIGFDSQGQYECFKHFKTFVLACELIRKWQRTNTKQFESIRCCAMRNKCQFVLVHRQNTRQWDGGITSRFIYFVWCQCIYTHTYAPHWSIPGTNSAPYTHISDFKYDCTHIEYTIIF